MYINRKKFIQISPQIQVSNSLLTNFSSPPDIFMQATDIHIAQYFPHSVTQLTKLLQMAAKIDPKRVIFTGDLVNSYHIDLYPPSATRNESHWQLYKQIRESSEYPESKIIEVLGNHDTWDTLSSEINNLPNKYTLHKITSIIQTYDVDGIHFVAFFPHEYPTGRGIHGFYPTITTKMMNMLEAAINTTLPTIILTHFSTMSVYPIEKTTSGRTLFELLNQKNILALLSGHSHPVRLEPWHHNSAIEIILPSLMQTGYYGLFSIDNGRFNYQMFNTNETEIAMLTYPIHDTIATQVYRENKFEIRLISFGPSTDKHYQVSGDVVGQLKPKQKVGKNVLYTLEVELPNGHHNIVIDGDYHIECHFSIGVETGGFVERQRQMFDPRFIPIGRAIFTVLDLFFLLGMIFKIKLFTNGYNLSKFPTYAKIFFGFLLIYPYILPSLVFDIQGKLALSTWYGYYVDGKMMRNDLDGGFGMIFMMSVLLPQLALVGAYWEPFDLIGFVEALIAAGCGAAGVYIGWIYLSEVAFGWKFFTSPEFSIIPGILFVINLVLLVKRAIRTFGKKKSA